MLSLYIDKKLDWKQHVQYITTKLITVYLLFKASKSIDQESLKTLYQSILYPHIDCYEVWPYGEYIS